MSTDTIIGLTTVSTQDTVIGLTVVIIVVAYVVTIVVLIIDTIVVSIVAPTIGTMFVPMTVTFVVTMIVTVIKTIVDTIIGMNDKSKLYEILLVPNCMNVELVYVKPRIPQVKVHSFMRSVKFEGLSQSMFVKHFVLTVPHDVYETFRKDVNSCFEVVLLIKVVWPSRDVEPHLASEPPIPLWTSEKPSPCDLIFGRICIRPEKEAECKIEVPGYDKPLYIMKNALILESDYIPLISTLRRLAKIVAYMSIAGRVTYTRLLKEAKKALVRTFRRVEPSIAYLIDAAIDQVLAYEPEDLLLS